MHALVRLLRRGETLPQCKITVHHPLFECVFVAMHHRLVLLILNDRRSFRAGRYF